jgi:hypothetical protein
VAARPLLTAEYQLVAPFMAGIGHESHLNTCELGAQLLILKGCRPANLVNLLCMPLSLALQLGLELADLLRKAVDLGQGALQPERWWCKRRRVRCCKIWFRFRTFKVQQQYPNGFCGILPCTLGMATTNVSECPRLQGRPGWNVGAFVR